MYHLKLVFANNAIDLRFMLDGLSKEIKEVGLSLNASKTKILSNGATIDIIMDGNKIKYVKKYVYLGHVASFRNCTAS